MMEEMMNNKKRTWLTMLMASLLGGLVCGCGSFSIDAGADQTVYEGEEVTLSIAIGATTGGNILWTQLAGPTVVLDNAESSQATFTAPQVEEGTSLEFRVTVYSTVATYQLPVGGNSFTVDGDLKLPISDTVTVTVLPGLPPEADAGADQSVTSGETVTLEGEGSTTMDNVELVYKWTQDSGPIVTLSDDDSARTYFVAPIVSGSIELQFALTVTSEENSATDFTIVTVEPKIPSANAGSDQVVTETQQVTLNASGSSDPNGGLLSYEWEQIEGQEVEFSSANAPQPFFTAPDVDEITVLRFQVTVTTVEGGEDSDDVFVTVTPFGPPTAAITGDQSAYEGQEVTLSGVSSSDPAGGELSYVWAVVDDDLSVELTSTTEDIIIFTAPTVSSDTSLTIQLTVENDEGNSGSTTLDITIQPYPDPVANAGADTSANEGTTVTLDGSRSQDPLGGTITYQWTAPSGITLSDTTTAKPVFTAPTVSTNTVYTITLTVTNEQGDTTTDSVDFTALNT